MRFGRSIRRRSQCCQGTARPWCRSSWAPLRFRSSSSISTIATQGFLKFAVFCARALLLVTLLPLQVLAAVQTLSAQRRPPAELRTRHVTEQVRRQRYAARCPRLLCSSN
jgi:hypothetical protein